MVLPRYLSTFICAVFIATGAVSGVDVMKAVGDVASFRPDKPLPSPLTSIIWKHKTTGGTIVKAIEWDEGEILIPNPRFKGITTVDEKTGEITITNIKFEHSGVYTIDINSKEQEQRFTLTVMEPVPQPVIKIEKTDNPDVVYLRCEYSEPIIWKNSTGQTLKGSSITPKGESITVNKNGTPENFYTCTLDNGASKKTSDRVYERDLFKDEPDSGLWWKVPLVLLVILGVIIGSLFVLYKLNAGFQKFVDDHCPCKKGQYSQAQTNSNGTDQEKDKSKQGSPPQNSDGANTEEA